MDTVNGAFTLSEVWDENTIRVCLSGELDLAAVTQVETRIDALKPAGVSVVLDLSRLTFMDSTGMACIARVVRDARQEGWDLVVGRELQGQVRRLIELVDGEMLFWPREG